MGLGSGLGPVLGLGLALDEPIPCAEAHAAVGDDGGEAIRGLEEDLARVKVGVRVRVRVRVRLRLKLGPRLRVKVGVRVRVRVPASSTSTASQ